MPNESYEEPQELTGQTETQEVQEVQKPALDQEKLNQLIADTKRKAAAAAAKELSAQYSKETADLKSELEELRARMGETKKFDPEAEKRKFDAELSALREANNSYQQHITQLTEDKIKSEIFRVASAMDCLDPEMVAMYLNKEVSYEGGSIVIKKDGEIRYGIDGNPTTLDVRVEEILRQKPHLRKPQGAQGLGTSSTSSPHKAPLKMPTNFEELASFDFARAGITDLM
jgi:hypothetical protein